MAETSGSGDYTLDSRILRIIGWSWASSGSSFKPRRVTVEDILRYRAGGTSTGVPQFYTVLGNNLLMVWPTPAAADILTIYYVPRPSQLVDPTDTPSEVPAEFHTAVTYYALGWAADYDDDGSSGQGKMYRDLYDGEIAKARRYVQTRGGPMPRLTVNRGGRAMRRHDNSRYP